MAPAIPACTIACCRLKASMSPGFAIAPAVAPWKTHKGFLKKIQRQMRRCPKRLGRVLPLLPETAVGQRKLQKHWQEAVLL